MAGSAIKVPELIPRLTLLCLLLAAFTTTWNGLRFLPAGQIGDVFLALTLALVMGLVIFSDLRFTTPTWIWIAPIAVMLVTAIRYLDPIPYSKIIMRYTEPPFAPNNLPKTAFWIIALVGVPVAIIACTKLYPRTPQMVMGAFTAGVCLSAAVGVSDLMGYTHIAVTYGSQNPVETRSLGLTFHANFLGVTCVIAIPLALYFIDFVRWKWKWLPALALICLFGGVLASGSRGAQVAAVLAAAAAVLIAPKGNRNFVQSLLGLGLAGVVVLAFAQIFLGDVLSALVRFGGGTGSMDVGTSDQTRTRLTAQALEDFQDYPVAGLGMKSITNAHGIYLQLLQAGGMILFIGLVVYWIWCLVDGFRLQRMGHPVARYLMVSICAWLVLGLIENQLTDRMLYYTVGCIAALSATYLSVRNRSAQANISSSVGEPDSANSTEAGLQLHDSRR